MNRLNITVATLFIFGAALILWNIYTVLSMADIWTDPLYTAYDQTILILNTLFWLIIGAALLLATQKRSRWVIAILCAALLYIITSSVLHVAPLAQFYLFNTSGLSGYKILAVVVAPFAAQIAIIAILLFASHKLHQSGHLS